MDNDLESLKFFDIPHNIIERVRVARALSFRGRRCLDDNIIFWQQKGSPTFSWTPKFSCV